MALENISLRQSIAQPDMTRRREAGRSFDKHLRGRGLYGMAVVGNVPEVLPPPAREALVRHGVSGGVYAGRMWGMSLAMPTEGSGPREVVLEERLMDAEYAFWREIARLADTAAPRQILTEDHIGADRYVYPFFGSPEKNARYEGRTLPDGTLFNDKAVMRQITRSVIGGEALVPGREVMYHGEDTEKYLNGVEGVIEQALETTPQGIFVKSGGSASGLLTVQYRSDMLRDPQHRQRIMRDLHEMMRIPDTDRYMPGNIVIENRINFGESRTGFGDYGIRGTITPDGKFVPFSVGRVISNKAGEYVGMVVTSLNNHHQLDSIGLHPETLFKSADYTDRLARAMYQEGYYGPVNLDYFAQQHDPQSPVLLHDFNMREGGTSNAAIVSALSRKVFGEERAILDLEIKLASGRALLPAELQYLATHFVDQRVFPYASNFLLHPKTPAEGHSGWQYTLKTMSPYEGSAQTDKEVEEAVGGLLERVNSTNKIPGVRFTSPM